MSGESTGPDFASLAMQHKASSGGGGGGAGKEEDPFHAAVAVIQKLGAGNIPFLGQYLKVDGNYFEALNTNGLIADTQGFASTQGKDMLGLWTMITKNITRDINHAAYDVQSIWSSGGAHIEAVAGVGTPPNTPGMGGGHSSGGHDVFG